MAWVAVPASHQRGESRRREPAPSPDPVGQSGLNCWAGAQGSQHDDRLDRGAGKLGRDIMSNAGKAQHMDVKRLAGGMHRFEILAAVVPQAQVQTLCATDRFTASACRSSWLRMAVRMKSVRFE